MRIIFTCFSDWCAMEPASPLFYNCSTVGPIYNIFSDWFMIRPMVTLLLNGPWWVEPVSYFFKPVNGRSCFLTFPTGLQWGLFIHNFPGGLFWHCWPIFLNLSIVWSLFLIFLTGPLCGSFSQLFRLVCSVGLRIFFQMVLLV